jgi:hypothetical protein
MNKLPFRERGRAPTIGTAHFDHLEPLDVPMGSICPVVGRKGSRAFAPF